MSDVVSAFAPGLFKGQHVWVSGASRGIGLAIALGFAKLGAQVVGTGLLALSSGEPKGENFTFRELDVRDRGAVRAFGASLPDLNVLVNAAGIARPKDEWKEEVYLEVMEVNLNSIMWTSNAVRAQLAATRGSILNIASMLSFLADPDVPAYCASKTGVMGLTRSLAYEFGKQGIRVNALAPGYHKTEMTRVHWENPVVEQTIAARAALKRWGTTDDLVGAAIFMASPAAQFVTGTTLPVDGGFVIG